MKCDAAKVRVLHVITDTNIGGAGRYLLTLLGRAEYAGRVDPEAACPAHGGLAAKLAAMGVTAYPLKGGDRSFDPAQLPLLYSVVARGRYDIVHTHASLTARIASRLVPETKIIFTKHTMSGRLSPAQALAQRILADRVICPSLAVRNELQESGLNPAILDLVYNGVDCEALRRQSQERHADLGLTRPVILSTGRLEPEKGHEYLLRAMLDVRERYPEATLCIAGEGSQRQNLRQLAVSLGLEEAFVLLGFRDDIPPLLAQADVFVLPSISEALGLSLLEAMAVGVPAVASSVGGVPEIISHRRNGLLTRPRDTEGLASAVLEILGDREGALALAREAKDTVETRFSAKEQAEATVASYAKALSAKTRSRVLSGETKVH